MTEPVQPPKPEPPGTSPATGSGGNDGLLPLQPIAQDPGTPVATFWTEKMAKWALFSVTMALVPLVAAFLAQVTRGNTPPWNEIVGRGELLLITAAICARSAGELFAGRSGGEVEKILAGGGTLVLMLLTAIYFADVASAIRKKDVLDLGMVTYISLVVFVCAILSGGRCIYLSERKP